MRLMKILLIVMLIVVTALYGWTTITETMSGKDVAPVISCSSDVLEISVADDESVLLTGITAKDQQDGDLTGKIQISGISKLLSDHTAKVSYVVFDRDHNLTTFTRKIRYTDYVSPHFSVQEPLIYYRSEAVGLLDRIRVDDCIDGEITDSVRVSGLNATSEAEVYTVDLQVTNSMGDTARLTLPVIQLEGIAIRPEVKLSSYLVYLSQGSPFNANNYLVYVDTPDGVGDKDEVRISGKVDTSTPGTYMVHYTYPFGTTAGTSVLTVVVE